MSTISSRFTVSFIANLVRSGVTFWTMILLARWLGPADYGMMSFLFATFTATRGMIDMGSSQAFFTLLSRRPRNKRFISIFWSFIATQLLLALLFLVVLLPDSLVITLWASESKMLLSLALLAAFMQGTVWALAAQMAEANRQTIRVQKINTAVTMLHFFVVVVLEQVGKLAVPLVFAALIIEWSTASWLASQLYVSQDVSNRVQDMEKDTARSVFREFFVYCMPLIPVTFLGFVHDFADRWMLQTWAGPKEQAYFSIAQQYSAIALLATVSVLRIFWKEIAEAHHQENTERVKMLYQRASRLLFFVGAFLAGGLQPLAEEVLRMTVGEAYLSGALTMSIMLLYPVHQSMGQIGGTMLFATGHTKAYALCSSISILVSLIVVYFMLAPASGVVPGLQLGAEGLALKLVCVQVFSVNLLCFVIARIFDWRFDWVYQVFALVGCLGLGWFSYFATLQIVGENSTLLLTLPLMAVSYIGLVVVYLYAFPWLLSMTREELVNYLSKLRSLMAIN